MLGVLTAWRWIHFTCCTLYPSVSVLSNDIGQENTIDSNLVSFQKGNQTIFKIWKGTFQSERKTETRMSENFRFHFVLPHFVFIEYFKTLDQSVWLIIYDNILTDWRGRAVVVVSNKTPVPQVVKFLSLIQAVVSILHLEVSCYKYQHSYWPL